MDSLNFPGQVHKWRLSQLLQKGTERSRESLLNDVALALRFLLVTARARFISHFFSVSQSLRSLLAGLLRLLGEAKKLEHSVSRMDSNLESQVSGNDLVSNTGLPPFLILKKRGKMIRKNGL